MKRRSCYFTAIASLLAGVVFTSQAIAGADGNTAVEMRDMVVTATRYEEAISAVPANVTVVTEKDIENSTARDIPDMLRAIAGIHVNDITGNRRNYTVDLRGFGETATMNTLVLVDGRRTNQADLSGTDWTQIPIDRVARIEIIRGGRASVLYGDNAAGGVVNIITKKGETFMAGGEAAGGSYESYKANAHVSGSNNNLSYAISGSYFDSDGYRDNSDTEAKDLGIDLGYLLGEIGAIKASYGYHEDSTSLPGALKASDFAAGAGRTDTINPNDFADTEDYYIKVGPEFYFLKDSSLKVDCSYRNREVTNFASGDWGHFEGGFEIETVTITPQMIIREKVFGKENTLTMGFDYTEADEDITNTSVAQWGTSIALVDMEKKNYGYYIHDEFRLMPALGLSAGYRYDRGKYEFASSAQTRGTISKTFDEELFTAGINYQLSAKSNIYASYSRSFRYPALDELFSFITNDLVPGLAPQTSDDYEIGIRHAITDSLRASLNVFKIDTEDELFYNRMTFSNANLDGDTEREGVEVSLVKSFGWGLASVSYAYTHAEIDGGVYDGSDFPNVPEHQAGATAVVDLWQPFTLALNGTYIGERPFISDFNNTFSDQDDFVVVNAKFRYKWKKVTAFLDVNNLFNEDYDEFGVLGGFPTLEPAFYPSPRTNFMAGVKVAF